jgi:hypothetical protein
MLSLAPAREAAIDVPMTPAMVGLDKKESNS